MKYYQSVGMIGGGLFRIGLVFNGAMGWLVYRRASRQRALKLRKKHAGAGSAVVSLS